MPIMIETIEAPLRHQCPDCRNEFVQPFVCTTCGAQKLYDATLRGQARTIEVMDEQNAKLREAAVNVALEAHMEGRIYTTGGEKLNPADEWERVRQIVIRRLTAALKEQL